MDRRDACQPPLTRKQMLERLGVPEDRTPETLGFLDDRMDAFAKYPDGEAQGKPCRGMGYNFEARQ